MSENNIYFILFRVIIFHAILFHVIFFYLLLSSILLYFSNEEGEDSEAKKRSQVPVVAAPAPTLGNITDLSLSLSLYVSFTLYVSLVHTPCLCLSFTISIPSTKTPSLSFTLSPTLLLLGSAASITTVLMSNLNPHGFAPPVYQSSVWAVAEGATDQVTHTSSTSYVICFLFITFYCSFFISIKGILQLPSCPFHFLLFTP